MKLRVLAAVVPAIAALTLAAPAIPAAAATPVITAGYTITYTCTGGPGCSVGGTYTHTYLLAVDCHGVISGTGGQAGAPDVLESVSGALGFKLADRTLTVNLVSTYVGSYPGLTTTISGTVDPRTGALSGTATSQWPGNPGYSATFTVQGTRDAFTVNPSACRGEDDD
jgi:hypothetical protein